MAKKILVTKEWHEQAMFAMHEVDKHINHNESFIKSLNKLKENTHCKREVMQRCINSYFDACLK